MAEAVYVRFDDKELKFINDMTKQDKITRSDAIKKLVNYASTKLKIENALNCYKDGKCTIREATEIADLRYFEFFDLLAKENLIGTSTENLDLLLRNLRK